MRLGPSRALVQPYLGERRKILGLTKRASIISAMRLQPFGALLFWCSGLRHSFLLSLLS